MRRTWRRRLVEVFDDFISQKKDGVESRLFELMEKNGFKITDIRKGNSITWHIMCCTLEKLTSLRWLFDSPSRLLTNVLQCIFTHSCGSFCSSQLSITWTTEDYEYCTSFLIDTHGRPFDSPKNTKEPPLVPDFNVSINLETKNYSQVLLS
jgi:hypothetical protein